MKEELIKIETAKLAKEKGFNIKTEKYWCNYYTGEPLNKWKLLPSDELSLNWMEYHAPTQSLLQRWLREVHKIDVYFAIIGTSGSDRYYFQISMKKGSGKYEWISTLNSNATVYKTPEKALEVGLQESLKLI